MRIVKSFVKPEDFPASPILGNEPGWPDLWEEWICYRAETGHALTPTAAKQTLAQLTALAEDQGFLAVERAVHKSIVNGWRGIFPDRDTKRNGQRDAEPEPQGMSGDEVEAYLKAQAEEKAKNATG